MENQLFYFLLINTHKHSVVKFDNVKIVIPRQHAAMTILPNEGPRTNDRFEKEIPTSYLRGEGIIK